MTGSNLTSEFFGALVSLAEASNRANLGHSYWGWWVFDTNCLSEIIKQKQNGKKQQVFDFLENRPVLISLENIIELAKRPDLLSDLQSAMQSAYLFILYDPLALWKFEIERSFGSKDTIEDFFSITGIKYLSRYESNCPFKGSSLMVEIIKSNKLVDKVYKPRVLQLISRKSVKHEPYLQAVHRINEWVKGNCPKEISIADVLPSLFQSFFSFFYTQYYWYKKQPNTRIRTNDFADISFSLISPYCERLYCERRLAHVLEQVKKTNIPSHGDIAKILEKEKRIDRGFMNYLKNNLSTFHSNDSILNNLRIYRIADLRDHIQCTN